MMYSSAKDMGVYLMRSDLDIKMLLQKSLNHPLIKKYPRATLKPRNDLSPCVDVCVSSLCEAACQARQRPMGLMIRADLGCLGESACCRW